MNSDDYDKFHSDKLEKSLIIKKIIETVRASGGQFLEPAPESRGIPLRDNTEWAIPSERVVREKIGSCLRDLLPGKYRSSDSSKRARKRAKTAEGSHQPKVAVSMRKPVQQKADALKREEVVGAQLQITPYIGKTRSQNQQVQNHVAMAPATQQDPFDNIDEYNPRLWQLPDRVSGSSSERLSPSMHPSNDQLDQSNPVVQSAPFANIGEGDTRFWPLLDFELDSNSELLSPSMRPSNDQLESSNPAVQQTPSANIDGYNTSLCQLPGLESAWSSELLHSPSEPTSPISNRKATPFKNSKKGWTTSEDEILVAALSQQPQPFSDWVSLVALLPGRTSKQIRDRWVNHLDPNLDHSVFSQDDFELIKKGVEQYGKRWTVISSKLFQSKRSENQIKNVFHTVGFRRYISSQYGNEVSQG